MVAEEYSPIIIAYVNRFAKHFFNSFACKLFPMHFRYVNLSFCNPVIKPLLCMFGYCYTNTIKLLFFHADFLPGDL